MTDTADSASRREPATITVTPNGPLLVAGDIDLYRRTAPW